MTKRLPAAPAPAPLGNTPPVATTSSPSAASARTSGAPRKGCSYPRSAITGFTKTVASVLRDGAV